MNTLSTTHNVSIGWIGVSTNVTRYPINWPIWYIYTQSQPTRPKKNGIIAAQVYCGAFSRSDQWQLRSSTEECVTDTGWPLFAAGTCELAATLYTRLSFCRVLCVGLRFLIPNTVPVFMIQYKMCVLPICVCGRCVCVADVCVCVWYECAHIHCGWNTSKTRSNNLAIATKLCVYPLFSFDMHTQTQAHKRFWRSTTRWARVNVRIYTRPHVLWWCSSRLRQCSTLILAGWGRILTDLSCCQTMDVCVRELWKGITICVCGRLTFHIYIHTHTIQTVCGLMAVRQHYVQQ